MELGGGLATRYAPLVDDAVEPAAHTMYDAFRASPLPLRLPSAGGLSGARERILEQFEDYVMPRLARMDAPALVVVGGPTGVGKSTLVNSLVGEAVTVPGLLRPTTRSPVLVHHPDDADCFGPDRLLPGLRRVTTPSTERHSIQMVATASAPRGLAILDAPDFDSIDATNRTLALRLLAAADLWLFVTSAARYSDQLPWTQLTLARRRNTPVAVVVSRIEEQDHATVAPHLRRMLDERGVRERRLFFVGAGVPSAGGVLPRSSVREIRSYLDELAESPDQRRRMVRQAVVGALEAGAETATAAASALVDQVDAIGELLVTADRCYDSAKTSLLQAAQNGSLLRGELLACWHDVVESDDLSLPAVEVMGRLRTRLAENAPGLRHDVDRLALALNVAIEAMVRDHSERAAGSAAQALRGSVHGEALLDWSSEDLARPSRALGRRIRTESRAWLEGLLAALREIVPGERTGDGTDEEIGLRALALALVVCAASRGVAQGSPDPAGLVDLTARRLRELLVALIDQERARYLEPVLGWGIAADAPERLRRAAADVARLAKAEAVR